jgi:hypothetical protein
LLKAIGVFFSEIGISKRVGTNFSIEELEELFNGKNRNILSNVLQREFKVGEMRDPTTGQVSEIEKLFYYPSLPFSGENKYIPRSDPNE